MSKPKSVTLTSLLGAGTKIQVTPDKVVSQSWQTCTFRITLGAGGLARNDSLGLVCGSNIDRWQFQYASHIWGCYTPWQTHDPAAPNFITATCSAPDAGLTLRVGASGGLKPFLNEHDHFVHSLRARYRYLLEIKTNRPLRRGDRITLAWGDRTWGSPGVRAPAMALTYYFLPFKFSRLPVSDASLPIRQGNFEALPAIRVTGQPAASLHCAGRPLAAVDTNFKLHCAAIDRFGNVDENFSGAVSINISGNKAAHPGTIIFQPRHKGRRMIGNVRFKKPGWHHIRLMHQGISSRKLPVLVTPTPPRTQIYFGDMHGHTLDDDGSIAIKDHYHYAREVAGLDFCSLSPHAEYFGSAQAWRHYLMAAGQANRPGRFVTFFGYEWAGEGHTNVYFMDPDQAQVFHGPRIKDHPRDKPVFRELCSPEAELLQRVKALPGAAFCIGHYHTRYKMPVDDSIMRLHEVYSAHRNNPMDNKLRALLEQGLHIGAVGGSDTHRLPLGSLCPDPEHLWRQPATIAGHTGSQSCPKKCGLQATFAPRLGRRELFAAMQQRLTYATTGARIIIILEINGALMGNEIRVTPRSRLDVNIRIGGTAPLDEISLHRYDGQKWSCPLRKTGLAGPTRDIRQHLTAGRGVSVYYLRVRQQDGEMAWSSPIRVATAL
ncbi:MAG: DUF3604 domain-containing protein [Kiritimatiellia bacterium]|nr:DUF3604 domain-containing protein [Lentisphaerota bacterium]